MEHLDLQFVSIEKGTNDTVGRKERERERKRRERD
jgi:hypothetical protein